MSFELEQEDRQRDLAFKEVLHGNAATAKGGMSAVLSKNKDAQEAAVGAYFKFWDNKRPENETEQDKKVGYCLLQLQIGYGKDMLTDLGSFERVRDTDQTLLQPGH